MPRLQASHPRGSVPTLRDSWAAVLYGLPPAPHSRPSVVLAPVPDSLDMVEVVTFDYDAQPKEMVQSCNLCGGSTFKVQALKDRYGLNVWSVKCHCGLVFLNPRMTAGAYREFYRDGHYRELIGKHNGKPMTAESIEESQNFYAQRLIYALAPWLKSRKVRNLLDIGGSTGVVANCLSGHFDIKATVLEPSEAEAKRAEDKGLNVIRGTIEATNAPESFDLVLVCQTIDHLLDISGALRKIRCLMTEDGLLFVDIVVNASPKIDHPYQLSDKTMADYFRRTGFKVLASRPNMDRRHHDFVVGRA